MARLVSLVALGLGLGLAGLLASPLALQVCASCGGDGSQRISLVGAVLLGATMLLLGTAGNNSYHHVAGTAALAGCVAAHAGLVLQRPAETCFLCGVILFEGICALLASTVVVKRIVRPLSTTLKATVVGAILAGVVAGFVIGALALPRLLDMPRRSEVLPAAEIAARSEAQPENLRGSITLHVILREGCPRCRYYWDNEHLKVAAALGPDDELRIEARALPGRFPPGAYPAFWIRPAGLEEEIGWVEGEWMAGPVIRAIDRARCSLRGEPR